MSTTRPWLILALMLAASALVLAGGGLLARRTAVDRVPADRALLRETAGRLQQELVRLDLLYERHLDSLSALADREIVAVRRAMSGIAGATLVASFHSGPLRKPFAMTRPGLAAQVPDPVIVGPDESAGPFEFALPAESLYPDFPSVARSGWIGESGDRWRARWTVAGSGNRIVVMVDSAAVRSAVEGRIREILPAVWAPVSAAGGRDRLSGFASTTLTGPADSADDPDFVVPVASRFGTMHIESRDGRVVRQTYDGFTLAFSGVVAAVLAAVGWLVADQQRRAMREAAARVSFVNRVSHELGSPLTNLRLNLDLLRDRIPVGAVVRLDNAIGETRRLERLVRNVLTFARSGRGALTLQPDECRPAEILRNVLEQFSPALRRTGVQVNLSLSPTATAWCDPDAFAQIAGNLISNAAKYADPGRPLELSAETTAGQFRLTVKDHGPGIPAAAADRVFLPFERVGSGVRETGSGTGLGLTIARDLARRMGGELALVAVPSGGSCFVLTLPEFPAAEPGGAPGSSAPVAIPSGRVVV